MRRGLAIAIVGGAGHIGAPLGIVLANRNMDVVLYDRNQSALDSIARGRMPFLEKRGGAELRAALRTGRLRVSTDIEALRAVDAAIVTIGTPIDEYHNPRWNPLTECVHEIAAVLPRRAAIILRSTISPGTTEFIDAHLRSWKLPFPLAFCPERVTQGNALEEITTLPQIVSGTSPRAVRIAEQIFGAIAPSVVRMEPREAELAKLVCNAFRYMLFAATNQLHMLVESQGIDYTRLLRKAKQGYPRLGYLPGAGFAAGPCLMKDTMQLFARNNLLFNMGHAAMLVNEGLPDFVVGQLARSLSLPKATVGVLGVTFKAESDDIRDSLAFKLIKILKFRGARVICSDEYFKHPDHVSKEALLSGSDAVIIGAPHRAYRRLTFPKAKKVIDIWGILH
jgi:UDP-N-acetyl-D-mannosaminuronic acid dehydrogenase